jgi:DNA-binding transcriptional regulator YbjK
MCPKHATVGEESDPTRTPNQEAARGRIVHAAADLIGREGLASCTLRAVAEEAGLTKSTVHYYFDDANELVDLSVVELFERQARGLRKVIEAMPDGPEALAFLVRLFMGRAGSPPPFRDGSLWPEYTAHAWKRGAHEHLHRCLEVTRVVFEVALGKAAVDAQFAQIRSAAVHDHLLGAMVRNLVQPIPRDEIARAISAVSGVDMDPAKC